MTQKAGEFVDISDLIGKPFRLKARGPDYYDCYGLVIEIAARRGYHLPDLGTPQDVQMRIAILGKLSSEYTECIDEPESYAIVVFRPPTATESIHLGTVLSDHRMFVHAGGLNPQALNKSVRIEYLSAWPWKNRIFGFFRLTKLCPS